MPRQNGSRKKDRDMGNSSSQLEKPTQKVDDDGDGDGTIIKAAAMSLVRPYNDPGAASRKVFGPRMSPSPFDEGDDLNGTSHAGPSAAPNPPSKKKQKKRRKSIDSTASRDADPVDPANQNDEPVPSHTKKSKKKSRNKSARQEEPPAEVESTQLEARDVDADQVGELPKRKAKKKNKKNATRDTEGTEEPGAHELVSSGAHTDQPPSTSEPQQSSAGPQSPALGKQKRVRRKKRNDHHDPDDELQVVAPDGEGSPPSAQMPNINRSLKYEPRVEAGADEQILNPPSQSNTRRRRSNQSQASALSASQIKTEAPGNDDEHWPVQFSGFSAVDLGATGAADENGLELEVPWLHKREADQSNGAPAPDTLDAYPGTEDEPLPDLLPSQIKSEHLSDTDSDSDSPSIHGSDSESPSAARADRLEKSRSRSASKASTSRGEGQRLTDEAVSTLFLSNHLHKSVLTDPSQLGISVPTVSKPSSDDVHNDLSSRSSTPFSGPPSTGSDHSIPPQIESQATSFPLEPSEQRPNKDSHVHSDASGIANGVTTTNARTTNSQARETSTNNGKMVGPTGNAEYMAPSHSQASSSQARKLTRSAKKKVPGSQSNNLASDRDIQVMEDWLEGNGRLNRNPQLTTLDESPIPQSSKSHDATNGIGGTPEPIEPASPPERSESRRVDELQVGEARDSEAAPAASHEAFPASLPQSSTKRRRPKSSFLEPEATSEPQQTVTASSPPQADERPRVDSVEPGESASQPQPKGRRKRKLQPKISLTLSQIEGNDPVEGESRLSAFSQRSKRKDTMRGGSNEPDPSEVGVSREPSPPPQQPRKLRKRRRTDNAASDDEMGSLLAAGPSRTRKRASNRDLDDDDDIRAAKRKRLSKNSSRAATGPWTAEEIKTLGRLYAEFRDAQGMTEEELNAMIHERPDKANHLHQDFWNRADVAIPQRTRKQIVERTRRLYNNFTARCTWTEEQKEEVHGLFEKHGNKFSHIAGLINRDQKDVRDYWRNHYLVHENQVKSRWSKEEEARLKEVVEEALGKIRIQRENSDELRTRPRAAGDDEESLLDWHQISVAMGLTRSRAQCKWKWVDMREKGLVGEGSTRAPTQAHSSVAGSGRRITDISEELSQAREGFDKMTDEDKKQLVEAIHDCKVTSDANIPWPRLVDPQFRAKWTRPTLRLAWYRMRRSVPDYDENTVEDNARYLLNHILNFQDFPLIREGHIDDLGEERLIHPRPGNRLWKRPSQDLRAIAERQRRTSRIQRGAESANEGVVRWLRDSSVDLGIHNNSNPISDEEMEYEEDETPGSREDVPIRIPKHLKGEAAKRALAEARAKASVNGSRKGKEPARGMRSASVAIDSDSE